MEHALIDGVDRDVVEEDLSFLLEFLILKIGHDVNPVKAIDGKLTLYVKGSDAVDFITEEFNPVGLLIREGEDIDNSPANGKVTGFNHEIHAVEFILVKHIVNEIQRHLLRVTTCSNNASG